MSSATLAPGSVRGERLARVDRARTEARVRRRRRLEPLVLFVLVSGATIALGLRTTVHLHLVYPDAADRLAGAFISWWNDPPRFRAIGFDYPPLQTVALLPFSLVRPLATSMAALPIFSGLCAGATVVLLSRALGHLQLGRGIRRSLLAAFVVNPLFLDYASNGSAVMLEMALLAAALASFTAFYLEDADSVRHLGACGLFLALGFLTRYETVIWLVLIGLIVAAIRWARGARAVEIAALEVILLAPIVYITVIWSAVSALVGGGGLLSWITRAGAEPVAGLGYQGHHAFLGRAGAIMEVLARISPLLLLVPLGLCVTALLLRRAILLALAALVLAGALIGIGRMLVIPNPRLLQPAYEMVALVPMFVGAGFLIAQFPFGRSGRPSPVHGVSMQRIGMTALILIGLLASVPSAWKLMRGPANPYDRAFTEALASHGERITRPGAPAGPTDPAALAADDRALGTFVEAAVYGPKTVLVDEHAFPSLILDTDTTRLFRTRAESGEGFWNRFLRHPFTRGKLRWMVVANPRVSVPFAPRDRVSERYRDAYAGTMARTRVVYRDAVAAVVELVPAAPARAALLPDGAVPRLRLYRTLPSLSPVSPARGAVRGRRARSGGHGTRRRRRSGSRRSSR